MLENAVVHYGKYEQQGTAIKLGSTFPVLVLKASKVAIKLELYVPALFNFYFFAPPTSTWIS